ncbi:aromatic acid exporter family protein [Bacillus sp. FJAT-47783]|uniref:FUSC family protein n=1 Tax=Bacillus sp. FJAT-47783 TaxID=2922712 RepID=UPI001FAE6C7B|nr:aromatic acid exporter family protein [Bacillus sp. FJAT-47783]
MTRKFRFNFVGGRVIKTGIAIFITVIICQLFELPTIFAVITAIVTIEPTAHDSIKKGMIRFPASTIGSAYAMTFTYLLGHSPFSYALSAMFTIVTCQKLRLEAGTLVATITAVAMIPITETGYLSAFFTRLMTTSVGIIVSTFVNFFILPPNYSPFINKQIHTLFHKVAELLELRQKELTGEKTVKKVTLKNFDVLSKDLHKAMTFIHYQQQDWKYHRHTKMEMRQFHLEQKKLTILQQINYHLGNLLYVSVDPSEWTKDEKELLSKTIRSISSILKDFCHSIPKEHYELIEELDRKFWTVKHDLSEIKPKKYRHHFNPKTVVLFEILSIHDMIEELEPICKQPGRLQMLEQ